MLRSEVPLSYIDSALQASLQDQLDNLKVHDTKNSASTSVPQETVVISTPESAVARPVSSAGPTSRNLNESSTAADTEIERSGLPLETRVHNLEVNKREDNDGLFWAFVKDFKEDDLELRAENKALRTETRAMKEDHEQRLQRLERDNSELTAVVHSLRSELQAVKEVHDSRL